MMCVKVLSEPEGTRGGELPGRRDRDLSAALPLSRNSCLLS